MVNGEPAACQQKVQQVLPMIATAESVPPHQQGQQMASVLAKLPIQHRVSYCNPDGGGNQRICFHSQSLATLFTTLSALRENGYILVRTKPYLTHTDLTFACQQDGRLTFESAAVVWQDNGIQPENQSEVCHQRDPDTPAKSKGLFLIILGPDGVGKSTLSRRVAQSFAPLFKESRIFHWRPGVIRYSGSEKKRGEPHSLPVRSSILSVLHLLMFFLDYWLGYLGPERKMLAGEGLVVFDRYLHDVMLDPFRYRYGGPSWFCRYLCSLVPPKDPLTLVLDAHEDVVFARKKDLSLAQIKDQRARYLNFAKRSKNAILINTSDDVDQTAATAFAAMVSHLESRAKAELTNIFPADERATAKP